MQLISVASAITLTEWSESTFRRKIASGSLTREFEQGAGGRAMVRFEMIRPHLCIALADEDIPLIKDADAGKAEAQNDLALLFLENNKARSAIYWFELAVRQEYPEAMHGLGRCYIDGNGIVRDEDLGMMWLAKAAAHDHVISRVQMQAIRDKFTGES
jgi:TPR repeat protein